MVNPIEPGLVNLGEQREVRIAGVRVAGRRRRPSGEKAPLQRDLRRSGRLWLLGGLAMVALEVSLFAFPESTNWWTDRDMSILEWFVDIRNDPLTSVADVVALLGSSWFVRVLRIGTLIALLAVRRLRHFFAVLLAIIVVQVAVDGIQEFVGRPRPFVPIIGNWDGASHPSGPVARLGVTVAAMAYTLVPDGGRRRLALGGGSQGGLFTAFRSTRPTTTGATGASVGELVGDEQWQLFRELVEDRDPANIVLNVDPVWAFS